MKYTLEIQKLLLQAQNKNLHPREKANLLKEAIRIADENEDVEWATEMPEKDPDKQYHGNP